MGAGGASKRQVNQAVGRQASLADLGEDWQQQQYAQGQKAAGQLMPFYSDLAKNGLPFYRNMTDYNSGAVAQAFAPQRAAILRRTSGYMGMPSGYRDAQLNNLGASQARAFDSTLNDAFMANQQAKMQGAAGLQGEQQIAANQGLAYGGQALNANQSVMGAPRKTGFWGAMGGALGSGLRAT